MEAGLTTEVLQEGKSLTIYVRGEIDIQTCARLRDAIEPHLGPAQIIVLDLGGVTFADSSIINTVVQARGRLTSDGGSLVLRNPSDAARAVLTLAQAEHLLDLEEKRHRDETA